MALHDPLTAEDQLERLIDARKTAAELGILIGRQSTLRAVAELADDLNCDEDEAEALVRAAIVGRSALVGTRIAEVVQHALYRHVLALAQNDLADVERARAESCLEQRIERALDARAGRTPF